MLIIVAVLVTALLPSSSAGDAPSSNWLGLWSRWDSGHYLSIATGGYRYVEGQPSNVAFFPLYPLLMRVIAGGSTNVGWLTAAGWLISNVATVFTFLFLYKLVLLDWNRQVARRTVWSLALFPTSFYLNAVYTEGLFLLLTVLAFYYARQNRWLAAGLLGGLSAATRFVGAFLVLPLAYEWYRHNSRRNVTMPALLLVPLGLVAYMLYLEQAFGDPLVFMKAAAAWGRNNSATGALEIARQFVAAPLATARSLGSTIDVAFALMGGVLLIQGARRQPVSYTLYGCYAVGIPVATLQLASIARYMVVGFPLFIALSLWLHKPKVFWLVMVLFGYTQAIFFARWVLHYWVA
jgi:hypothetical protein